MTSDQVTFRWIEIQGFRGFNHAQRIDLDASAIIVSGPNGTGKTSFFDAVQWLLVGSLQRLEKWRVRRTDDHITNLYTGSAPAVVSAEVELRGQVVQLRRQGRSKGGLLEWKGEDGTYTGVDAEKYLKDALTSRPGQDVRRLLMTSALLQQDEVREVLEDKPADRYQQLAAILGLDEIAGFESAAKKRAERLTAAARDARATLESAQGKADAISRRIEAVASDLPLADDVRVARAQILDRLRSRVDILRLVREPSTSAEGALLQQAADEAGRRLADLRRRKIDLDERRSAAVTPDEEEAERLTPLIASGREVCDEARARLEEAEHRLMEAVKTAEGLSALAAQAIDLLGSTCPVCGQSIDEHEVRDKLQNRIEGDANSELAGIVSETAAARSHLAQTQEALTRLEAEAAPVLRSMDELEQLRIAELEWIDQAASFATPEGAPIELLELSAIRMGDVEALQRAVAALQLIRTAASELVAILKSDRNDQQLVELRAEQRRATDVLETLKGAVHLASQQEDDGRRLWRAATAAVSSVTERRFRQLAPTVQDIFFRLDPHPAFTRLDFELDIYYNKGIASPIVTDALDPEIQADPLLVFSSSQANITALSYFLAVAWASGRDALPFVLLDDPFQSMDDINALGFADLCRYMRRHRQVMLSTHESRFASLLRRKLTPRDAIGRTRVIDFKAWTRAGPIIEQELLEPQVDVGRDRSIATIAA
jgi:DNA repair exonuclease SbcCD ATPase subunit